VFRDQLLIDKRLRHGLNEPIFFMGFCVIQKMYPLTDRAHGIDPIDAKDTNRERPGS